VFIQPLVAEKVPVELREIDRMAFASICRGQNADLVGTIRVRMENGEPVQYHSFITESPTESDLLLKDEALLRIATGFDESAAKRLAEDATTLSSTGAY
jgi:hypothetical protein